MATSHILSAIEPNSAGLGSLNTSLQNRSPDVDRNVIVSLDDRELWMRFQNLTNEMIVTKNGRFVAYIKYSSYIFNVHEKISSLKSRCAKKLNYFSSPML